jgi:RNA polymerase sigma-70 factor (ECF subfamily)
MIVGMWLQRDPFAHPEELVQRVYAYVAYRIGPGPDAEDVTNEAFARALRYRASYDARKGPAAGWVIGIARRLLSEAHPSHALVAWSEPEAAGEGFEPAVLERIQLQRAVATLSERDRELVALRYGADLSARQIAEQLGLETHAVEVALSRALAALRGRLSAGAEVRGAAHAMRQAPG